MSKKFRVGDKVKVVGMSPVTFAPGVKDELGTEKLFKSMLGKVYTISGLRQIWKRRTPAQAIKHCLGRAGIFEIAGKKAHPEVSLVHMPE